MNMITKDGRRICRLLVLLLLPGLPAWGDPPDLTAPGTMVDTTYTYNLGPTGARGWIYCEGSEWSVAGANTLTIKSRQILITQIDAGSPAPGVLQVNDVILGIGSTLFTSDARKAFGNAITLAEQTANGGQLRLKVWRNGVTNDNVLITLPVMGSYSATAPYNCPKSALILSNACAYMAGRAINSGYTEGNALIGLALLAAGRAQDVAKVQTYARSVASSVGTLTIPVNEMVAWPWGYNNTFLSEYYLATGDTNVLPAIIEYTTKSATGQSWVGTYGHGMAWPRSDGTGTHGHIPVYGAVNQAGLTVNIGIALGKMCMGTQDATNATEANIIANAITRARNYFGFFAGRGAIPYGESPGEPFNDDNGKNGEAAFLMALQGQADMSPQVQFFAKGCTAGYSVRDFGHTCSFWAQLWQPLAANLGGTNAMAAYFQQIEWEADLARRPDGSFAWNHFAGGQPGVECLGTDSDTAKWMLAYATGLQKIYLTGRNSSPNNWLSPSDAADAVAAGVCTLQDDMASWSTNQLVTALSSWSPWVRDLASKQLTSFPSSSLTAMLTSMAESTNLYTRLGATEALALQQDTTALPELLRKLNDSDYTVRWTAAGGYNGSSTLLYKTAARSVLTNMLSIIISNEVPYDPVIWSDPCQFAQGYLGSVVFGGQLAGSVSGVPTNLLYPAIGAMSRSAQRANLAGFFEGSALSANDVRALAPVLTTALMTSHDLCDCWTGQGVISLLSRYNFEEGIAAAMTFRNIEFGRGWYPYGASISMSALQKYRSAARNTLPELNYWNTNANISALGMNVGDFTSTIAAIENDTSSSPPTLLYFKTIGAVSASSATFAPPVYSTTLRASGCTDIDGNTASLIYTWSKIRGAGPVTFSANSTTASSNITATFSVPGNYVLQLLVADGALGVGTNGWGGVTTNFSVTFGTVSGNQPPVVSPMAFSVNENSNVTFTLAGTDPEGYELYYSLASLPANGTLSTPVPFKSYTLPGTMPTVTYTPNSLYVGADSFTYTVMDSEGLLATNTVSFIVSLVGIPPAALNRSLPVPTNTPTPILLTGSDPNSFPLTFAVVTPPAHGLLSGFNTNSGALTYTPAPGYNGLDSFTFKVNNGTFDSTNIATVFLSMGTLEPGIYSEFFQQPPSYNGWYDMADLLPDTTRIDTQMSIGSTGWPTNYTTDFTSRHIAYVNIVSNGNYTFSISADDNTMVYVDETWVIQSIYGQAGWNLGPLYLTSGYHGIRVEYVQFGGDKYFTLNCSGPGQSGLIPSNRFVYCVGNPGPLPPANLLAAPGNAMMTLSWTASGRATGYNLKRALVSGGPYTTIAANLTNATYIDLSVTNGTTYYYVVTATGAGGEGLDSNEAYGAPVSTAAINVNISGGANATMNGYASSNTNAWGSASRAAPVVYAGTNWNDFGGMGNGTVKSSLKNSTNATTGVGFVWGSVFTAGPWADWTGLGSARLLVSGLIGSSTSFAPAFTLTGLNPARNYDLYVASGRSTDSRPADFQVGAATLHVQYAGATDWAAGDNYVRFANLVPAADGTIAVNASTPAGLDYACLDGFQLVDVGIQPPAIPAGLTASGTTVGGAHINLSWTAAAGATGYLVKRASQFDGPYTVLGPASGTTYTDYAVAGGGTYYYVVSGTNPTGESGNSAWNSATVVPLPDVPTGLAAVAGSSLISLSWQASSWATGYSVKRSTISGGGYATIGAAAGTNYTDSTALNGTPYYYVVSATNSVGESAMSAEVSATAVASSAKDILAFSFGALGSATIAGTSITLAVPYGTPVTNLAPTYTVSPLASGAPASGASRDFTTPQTYTIAAQDLSTKVYTVMVTFVPAITTASLNVTATGTGSEIVNNGTLMAANHVGSGAVAPVTLANGLTFGTSTAYLTGYGTGAWGSGGQRTDTDAQGLVPALAGTNDFQKLMRSYDWGSQDSSQMAIPGLVVGRLYRLQLISDSPRAMGVSVEGGASVAWPDTYTSTPSVMTAVWMASDTTANVVFTRNHSFSGAHDNEILITGYALHDITPAAPPAPAGLTAVGTNAQVNLIWTASSGATGYSVKRSLTNGGPYSVTGGTAGVTYADTAVTNGTWYYYVVSATNIGGASAISAQASARPLGPTPTPVLPVGGVKLTNGVPSFNFTAAGGCKYRLDYKNALTDAVWTPGAWSTNSASSPAPMTLTDPSAPGWPQRFYRLEAANP